MELPQPLDGRTLVLEEPRVRPGGEAKAALEGDVLLLLLGLRLSWEPSVRPGLALRRCRSTSRGAAGPWGTSRRASTRLTRVPLGVFPGVLLAFDLELLVLVVLFLFLFPGAVKVGLAAAQLPSTFA